jgi:ACS family D-galactonate transporter-like MFS transporter
LHEATAPDREKLSRPLRRILLLLAVSVFINYIDRGNLSIAAPLLKDELRLSPWQLGILLSSFFWTYDAFQIPSGWLIDRFDVSWVLAFGFFIWSCATAATGAMGSFGSLLAARLVLGVGEAVAYPSYAKILARDFSACHRGLGNGAIAAGQFCGPAFGTFLGGLLIARFGWRPLFIVLGLASLVWLIPWFNWRPRVFTPARTEGAPRSQITAILGQPSLWGACVTHFCCNYLVYFLLTWLPYYLVRERHFSIERMAKIGGMAFLCSATSSVISGWISDQWIVDEPSSSRVRKSIFACGLVGAGLWLVLCVVASPVFSIVLLFVSNAFYGVSNPLLFAGAQTLAGPRAAGEWMGVQNFAGNLAGIVAPALTGLLVDRTGYFFWPFLVVCALSVIGSLSWLFVVGPIEPVSWPDRLAGAPEGMPPTTP